MWTDPIFFYPILLSGKTLDESTKDNRRIGEDTEAERGGWLRGRSSAGAGECLCECCPSLVHIKNMDNLLFQDDTRGRYSKAGEGRSEIICAAMGTIMFLSLNDPGTPLWFRA